MAALGVLSIGAAGAIALEKVVSRSGARANTLAVASAVASSWAERLHVDGLRWGAHGLAGLDGTLWLRAVEWSPGEHHAPAPGPTDAPVADRMGLDVIDGDDALPVFCTHVRLTRLGPLWPELVRAEIRVVWERALQPMDCGVDPAVVDADPGRFGAIYLVAGVLGLPPGEAR
ncbi:type IV pilus modification PilV family protein [Chondromyces crocatus]|uniref:Uncharacterized protein n=1 Tax=Chondromyces crocatus TaxID=52 RepID=A0A0K1E8G7_CHOCO|nr:hypothetical protein [Chondromyces crocatus]AKT37144.1 uncharacterized protein CMC5_012740 [Chondromyces crocatus]